MKRCENCHAWLNSSTCWKCGKFHRNYEKPRTKLERAVIENEHWKEGFKSNDDRVDACNYLGLNNCMDASGKVLDVSDD